MSTILVVEDDLLIAEVVREFLEDAGHRVIHAVNGRDAMRALRSLERPCLVLLDLMMPVMDGWQFMEVVQKDVTLAPIPIAVTSAVADDRARERARVVLRKPYDLDVLLRIVDEFCLSTDSPENCLGSRLAKVPHEKRAEAANEDASGAPRALSLEDEREEAPHHS